MPLDKLAFEFATKAHKTQKRKYTNDPYITHPVAVANIVASVTSDQEIIAAALLHDILEDTDVQKDEIQELFGIRVATLVSEVTNQSKPEDGSREVRKEIDRQHIAKASPDGKTIKLADIIHNTSSIMSLDKDFGCRYLQEKRLVIKVLKEGNPELYDRAMKILVEIVNKKQRTCTLYG